METVRLRAIQQPSRVERLLVAFALRSGLMAPDAYTLRDRNAMPTVLQGVIFQAVRKNLAWCCWKESSKIRLLTGDMLLDRSREHGSPVLNVQLYGEDGELKDNDSWVVDKDGKWGRCGPTNSPGNAAR